MESGACQPDRDGGRAGFSKRVWVLGGAGFIGSHLCERLVNDGYQVLVFDNLSTGRRENIPDGVEWCQLDVSPHRRAWSLRQPDGFHATPDIIYHLASPASPTVYHDRLRTFESNVLGVRWALEQVGVPIIFASSSEVYGRSALDVCESETTWQGHEDSDRANYAGSKLAAEAYLSAESLTPSAIVRLFNTYGPRCHPNDGRVIPTFIDCALRKWALPVHGGSQTRSWCYVSDTVEALIRVKDLLLTSRGKYVLNVGNPRYHTSIAALADMIAPVGKKVIRQQRHSDVLVRSPNIDVARKLLDWEPTVSLEDGLKLTTEWHRSLR